MSSESEAGYQISEIPQNTILIIFGASGDLTRRKLMPALYHLAREMLLPTNFLLIGIGLGVGRGMETYESNSEKKVAEAKAYAAKKQGSESLTLK